MSKPTVRRLTVAGQTYVWTRRHRHQPHGHCEEWLTVYLAEHKRSPLQLGFSAAREPGLLVGHPRAGVVEAARGGGDTINLNRPGVVAAIVRAARQWGWDPASQRSPTVIENSFQWLRAHVEIPPESPHNPSPQAGTGTSDSD